ncbi:hypothetical protein CCMSSC00406_0009561 [Pleurotus cornucopiae]|uniref:Uncharacterized protein n=1 Tax=Pleurotus cornucopiae TaxID=5321 RepID=A0ACB7IVF4_PLECO|nr:hypothetical protein CCMSSC00406_0009561 [Pleurotus cornucopiae]
MATPTHEHTTTTPTVPDDVETKSISNDIVPYTYLNRLTPPIGTTFFHKETITIFDNQQISVKGLLLETLTWRTDVYKYATGARPDKPDFKKNGGEIYIIMVHAGTGRAPDVLPFFELTKTVKVPSSIIPVKQYPASNSGTPSGSDLAYKIDYSNAMAMFKDGGNSSFPFDASYQEDFVRHQAEQTGLETTDGVEFGVVPGLPFHSIYTYPIIGLSVFKSLDPSAFPATFTFRAGAGWPGSSRHGSITKDVSISFDFTP